MRYGPWGAVVTTIMDGAGYEKFWDTRDKCTCGRGWRRVTRGDACKTMEEMLLEIKK